MASNIVTSYTAAESGEVSDIPTRTSSVGHETGNDDNDGFTVVQSRRNYNRNLVIFETFLYSGLHIENPRTIVDVYAIAQVKERGTASKLFTAKNSQDQHAEIKLMAQLRSYLQSPTSSTLFSHDI